jgi:DNA modification methylase
MSVQDITIIRGDARRIPLADGVVQCIVTSPPYWGLRKYAGEQESVWGGTENCQHQWAEEVIDKTKNGTKRSGLTNGGANQAEANRFLSNHAECLRCAAWRGGFGLEPTIAMYMEHTIEILRECRRVLRPDGVLFWNLDDSYAAGGNGGHRKGELFHGHKPREGEIRGYKAPPPGLKPKDLCLIPERVAIAAQEDGWWVRSIIVWAKPNPMPESCTDRPTSSYERIIMLTKSERYFWDADAVQESTTGTTHSRGYADGGAKQRARENEGNHVGWADATREILTARNLRNVWTFATQPYKRAHFATFPEELPRRCILAATSERGACTQCGAPWKRVTLRPVTSGKSWNGDALKSQGVNRNELSDFAGTSFYANYSRGQTIGWSPTCRCRGQHGCVKPCLVLDPFAGSGTTGRVAVELNRRAVLLDLAYHDHAQARTRGVQRQLVAG